MTLPVKKPLKTPPKVAVLVDLPLSPNAGGHVKCWEKFAQAALNFRQELDITIYFSGEKAEWQEAGPHVRYRLLPPAYSSARLPFLNHMPDHSDLAPYHRLLARELPSYDVIHTTDAYFAYARTALRYCQKSQTPLVNSVHTDTPGYARLYSAVTLARLFGKGRVGRFLLGSLALPDRIARRMENQLKRHQAACRHIWVSRPEDYQLALRTRPAANVGWLRRGIDRNIFNPEKRDREWLQAHFGVGQDQCVVLFVGRVDDGKNVSVVVEAVRQLVTEGRAVTLFCAGAGPGREAILQALGQQGVCPGNVGGETLPKIYASADIFVQPSKIEIMGNVVMEGLSSGLPVLVAREGGMNRLLKAGVNGEVLNGSDPGEWAGAIRALQDNPARRQAMGRAARIAAEQELPSWEDVLAEDLLPCWTALASPASILRRSRADG